MRPGWAGRSAKMNNFIEFLNILKRGVISPVYLFYGEEGYLRDQALARLREFLGQDGEAGFNYDLIEGETASPADIAARAETLPFFAARRLVVVKNPTLFKSVQKSGEAESKAKAGEAPLLKYLQSPPETTCLVFSTGDPVDRRKRLFQAVSKSGRALEFTFLSRGELARWLAQKAGAAGRRFSPGAADVLLDAAGPSLQRLVVELEKLLNYTEGKDVIGVDEVRRLCPPRLEDNIFSIVDAVGGRRCGEALSGIKEMLAAKEPPLKILAMISRQFRLLLQVHDLLGRGCPVRDLPGRLNLHPYVAQKVAAQCKNFSRPVLIGAVHSLSELDAAVKTGRQEFYPAVELFLLKLSAGKC